MCISPIRLKDNTQVACRGCRVCRDNRLNDLIGRCLAEQQIASQTFAVTLTYAGDTPHSAYLNYHHIQLFLKGLRNHGYSPRYICCGEYGTIKGRAHWHIILFFYGKSPDVELDRRIDWEFWPHGFSYFQRPDYRGFRYVMKYALKDQNSRASTRRIAMSKKPPLGYRFFMSMARDMVAQRIPIHDPSYSFIHVTDRKGAPRRYWLRGRMRELFCEEYERLWIERYNEDIPQTDWIIDNPPSLESDDDALAFEAELSARAASLRPVVERQIARIKYDCRADGPSAPAIGYLFLERASYGLIVAYADNTASLDIGGEIWTIANVSGAPVAQQLERTALPRFMLTRVSAWLEKTWSAGATRQPPL